jgi:toxin ParE1/3/4
VKLEWSVFALEDRNRIFDYIEHDNPRAAVSVDGQINTAVRQLEFQPESGRLGRVEGTREIVIRRTPYIAAYRVRGGIVRILRILHGAQQWPEDMP